VSFFFSASHRAIPWHGKSPPILPISGHRPNAHANKGAVLRAVFLLLGLFVAFRPQGDNIEFWGEGAEGQQPRVHGRASPNGCCRQPAGTPEKQLGRTQSLLHPNGGVKQRRALGSGFLNYGLAGPMGPASLYVTHNAASLLVAAVPLVFPRRSHGPSRVRAGRRSSRKLLGHTRFSRNAKLFIKKSTPAARISRSGVRFKSSVG